MMRWICDCFFCELDGCWWCLEIQYYPVHHTSMHRYCTLFFHLLDIAATNHFLPYKELCREKQEEPMTHITFLEGLAASLCGVKISAPPAKAKSANVPVAKSNLIQARWPCIEHNACIHCRKIRQVCRSVTWPSVSLQTGSALKHDTFNFLDINRQIKLQK